MNIFFIKHFCVVFMVSEIPRVYIGYPMLFSLYMCIYIYKYVIWNLNM